MKEKGLRIVVRKDVAMQRPNRSILVVDYKPLVF